MAESQKALVTQIKADEKLYIANQRAMEKVKVQLQCKCTHRAENGEFALFTGDAGNSKKSKYTGAPLYRCKVCKKEIDISNISDEEFNRAVDVLNRICDLTKMHLNLKSEKDQETLKRIKKFQFRLNDMIPDAYTTIRKGGRNKKKKTSPIQGYIDVAR